MFINPLGWMSNWRHNRGISLQQEPSPNDVEKHLGCETEFYAKTTQRERSINQRHMINYLDIVLVGTELHNILVDIVTVPYGLWFEHKFGIIRLCAPKLGLLFSFPNAETGECMSFSLFVHKRRVKHQSGGETRELISKATFVRRQGWMIVQPQQTLDTDPMVLSLNCICLKGQV
jgi:hypothetical protein